MMDYMPIMFIVLIASIYFWREVVGNWILVLTFTLLPIIIYRLIYETLALPHSISISIGYSVMALVVIVPTVLHCVLRHPAGWKFLAGAMASFCAAIAFRVLDDMIPASLLPMGSHFLWHIFGGLCCFFMLYYVYGTEVSQIRNRGCNASAVQRSKALVEPFDGSKS